MESLSLFPPGTPVLALPGWRQPRLYLPAVGLRQRWAASSLYPAHRFRARLGRCLFRLKAALRLGAVRMARSSAWELREFIKDLLPQVTSAVVLVGTAGPTQKFIVQLLDDSGTACGYVKCAQKGAARRRLRHEHHLLSHLPPGVGPKPLRYGCLAGGEALLMTPLSGKPVAAVLPPDRSLESFLRALEVSPVVNGHAHPWLSDLHLQGRPEVSTWIEVLEKGAWPRAVCHGDFAPWNLLARADGSLCAMDWEHGTCNGFPYLDQAYYILQTGALIYRWKPQEALQYGIRYLAARAWPALARYSSEAIIRLAAYDAYQKSAEDGHPPDYPIQAWRRAIWACPNGSG